MARRARPDEEPIETAPVGVEPAPAAAYFEDDAVIAASGPIVLLPGRTEFPETMLAMFPDGEVTWIDEVGGAVMIATVPQGLLGVCFTVGLSRLPLDQGDAAELFCVTQLGQEGAGAIALRIAVERVAEERSAWATGEIWLNDTPFLRDTRIQAMVAAPGPQAVRAVDGTSLGFISELLLLTAEEAMAVADGGFAALQRAMAANPLPGRDVQRESLVTTLDASVSVCAVSRLVREHDINYVQCGDDGSWLAVTGQEPENWFDDSSQFDLWSLRMLVQRYPGLEELVRTGQPGDSATCRDGLWTIERRPEPQRAVPARDRARRGY